MSQNFKRRLERRIPLKEPLPVRVWLRSLSRQGGRGVDGRLMNVSQKGMGILVQEHIALASRCSVEVLAPSDSQVFQAEICYATRTDEGIRLGILLDDGNKQTIMDFLKSQKVELL